MLVRLADFLRDTVAKRRIPEVDPERPPRVVMKMDIEGSEVEVVADLISSGSIRFVNVMMAEWHERYQLKPERLQLSKELKALTENHTAICSKTNILSQDSNGCDFENIEMDDETYASSEIPLPKCWRKTYPASLLILLNSFWFLKYWFLFSSSIYTNVWSINHI